MRSQRSFADQGNANADCAKNQWLPATNPIEEKDNEEEVKYRADDIVDAGHKKISVTIDPKVVVQNGRVVADDIDSIVRQ